jgi:chemotaxis protein methyltransferase CheR
MAVMEAFRRDDPPATILATDIDAEALAVAARGEYGARALQALAPERRARFFGEAAVAGRRGIIPAARRLVDFRELNLAEVLWPIAGQFDVIFCRNVLMYLEACHRYAVLEHIASLLAPQGLLILDPAEHLGKAGHLFAPGTDGVYARAREACPRRGVARRGAGLRHPTPMKIIL